MSNSKKLLVVVDMQHDFIDGVLGSPEAESIVPKVEEFIKNYKGTIVFTQDTHQGDGTDRSVESDRIPEHCISGTHGWDILESLIQAFNENTDANGEHYSFGDPSDNIYIKPSFASGELIEDLIYNLTYCDEIDIVGVCTDICVVSNALAIRSARPDATIRVHSSLCAGTTPDKHEAALSVMESCLIDIV